MGELGFFGTVIPEEHGGENMGWMVAMIITEEIAKASKGLSAFVIEPKNFNGVKTTRLEKLGSNSSPTGEIFLTNVLVPKKNIRGKPGDGARIMFESLNNTRLSAAAGATGLAQACLDVVIK